MAGRLVIDGRNFVDPEAVAGGRLHLRGHRALALPAGGADMQALILAGGEGTRLRPLTSTIPKPVVPLVGRPFISYMLEWLRRHGVEDVILGCGFMADARARRARATARPSGSACATSRSRAARHRRRAQVRRGPARRALLHAQRRRPDRHRPDRPARAARADRAPAPRWRCIRSRTPRRTGWCAASRTARCSEFIEKPGPDELDTNLINAGAYILERDVLDGMPPAGTNVSIEREVFPTLVGRGPVRLRGERLLAGHRHARIATCRRPTTSSRAR